MPQWEFLVEGYTVEDRIMVPVPVDSAEGPRVAAGGKPAAKGSSGICGKRKKTGAAAAEKEKSLKLFCSAWGYGNYTALVNDSIMDPMLAGEEGQEEFKHQKRVAEANLEVFNIYVRGWPFQFMISTRDIKEGEDLYYNYGHE
jgi:hypothetical protein